MRPTPEHLSRVEHIATRCSNRDLGGELAAARALDNHTAAFWATASVRNDPLWAFVATANNRGGIIEAWEAIEGEQPHQIHQERGLPKLDAIIPLNLPAIVSLQRAYAALGSFRDREELARRCDRAEGIQIWRAA